MSKDESGLRPPYLILALAACLVASFTLFDFGGSSSSEDAGALGAIATEIRPFAGDTKSVVVAGPVDTRIQIGPQPSIEIEGPATLRPHIVTELRDGALRIGFDGKQSARTRLNARVTLPAVETLRILGSGDAELTGLAGGPLTILVEGAGDVEASGTVDRTDVVVRGAGDVDLSSLATRDPSITIKGAGNVDLGSVIDGTARVDIGGSGNVSLSGHASRLEVTINANGDLDASELNVDEAHLNLNGNGLAEVSVQKRLEVVLQGKASGVTQHGPAPVITTDLRKKR